MPKLFLFDIDNTLITSRSRDSRFENAIKALHNLETSLEGDYHGYTDQLILAALLEGEGWDDEQIRAAMPKLLFELDVIHADSFNTDSVVLLPGVTQLLEALKAQGHKLGLITGNVKTIAQRKLEAVDIWAFFELGGFGDDTHEKRADLVTLAIERAEYRSRIEDVYVVGDTKRDVAAAHEAGVKNSIAVCNGFRNIVELSDAKFVLETLEDTDLVLRTVLA